LHFSGAWGKTNARKLRQKNLDSALKLVVDGSTFVPGTAAWHHLCVCSPDLVKVTLRKGESMTARGSAGFAPERLASKTAADIMTRNPISIRDDAGVQDLIATMTERNLSGLPVINEAGRPVGVVTQADVLIHDRERREYAVLASERRQLGSSARIEVVDPAVIADIMTPAVFSVALDTPARKVIEHMVEMQVHRLFVVDKAGALVGVISPLDVLRSML
jgi:CBS domain-containing protein